MNCPSCDGKNREDARFCKFCGTDLDTRCRMCGALLDDDARFCDACGTPAADMGAPAPVAAAAARKVVTVMFADLSGSTALEERMDAESVRSILDRFYAAMRSEVERHGGKVVKFTGDGVMAAFGVPEVHEDDAARAVDASLAMREELEQLASDLQLDVALNIGVNTGEVVVSETDDDVVGDAVNVAARLEGAATGGEILVGAETWRLTRATSRYELVEPLTLKGKSEPVPAYRLLSVDERTADSAAAPFVGRESELGRLMNAFQGCVDANAARLVTIIGSPGLGKTRLARELMSELADVARVREARCDPAGSSTFAPIADALRAGGGMSETDTEEEIIAALAARLEDDDPDRDRVAARAASIFGVGVPGTTEETFWALRKIIEAAARVQPVVFVLDDIHWAEPLLLDLIEHLAEWIRDAPVLLVGTARPELRDLRPSLVEGGRAAEVIALEGLDRAATARLALNLLETDTLPDELLAKIPASTEGNPLFVRELVRMLVDDGVLRRTSDGWDVTVDVDAIQVPPTISSLLSARVDRLRNDERTVVELASVVGKEFYRGAIVDLAPDNVKDLVDGCLESLRRKELVEPVGTYWIDEPVYTFHHALIQDAAYRRVLKERRAELHERVAGWLEVKTADVLGEHDELLGYHLEQAHEYKRQLGRPDDDLGSRAAELLGRAAQRALESDDLPAAATLSGRALDRLSRSDERLPGLLLIRCEALLSMGDVAQGSAAVAELDGIASSPRLRAWATCFHGQLATLTSSERLQETEALVAAAAADLTGLGDQAGAAKAHTVHASTLAGLGRFAECEAVLDQALTAARAANDRRRITATLGSAPHAALWGPNPVSRAGGRCLDIVRLLRITTGSPAVEATSLRCQAVLEAFRGRADAARRMLGSARRTLSELGLEHELLEAEQFSGIVELVDGDAAAAEQHLRDAFEGFTKVGVDVLAAQSAARLARALLNLGEDEEAESFLAFAEQHGGQDLKTALSWRSSKAELLARRGEFADARALAEEAVAIAERTDALIDHGIACRSLGVVLRAAGDAAGAREAEARALALFERKGATALIESTGAPSRTEASPEPTPSTATARPQNASTRQLQRYVELFARRAWDEIDALTAPDCWFDDHRAGIGWSAVGANAATDSLKAMAEARTVRIDVEPVATRGERASLIRWIVRGRSPDSFVTDILIVVEIDASDRVAALVVFDLDAVVDAVGELDRRFHDSEGADHAGILVPGVQFSVAVSTNDWELMRSVVTEDIVLVDHRPASWGELTGHEEMRALFMSGTDISARRESWVTSYLRLSESLVVTDAYVGSVSQEGVRANQSRLCVVQFRGTRICRIEYFAHDAPSAALARFDELAALSDLETPSAASGPPLRNTCSILFDRLVDALHRRDWAAARSLYAEDVVFDDNRAGLTSSQVGADTLLEHSKVISELGGFPSAAEVVAVRGERLGLFRVAFDVDDFTIEVLQVAECGTDGTMLMFSTYDGADLSDAIAELDRRFVVGEGEAHSEVVRLWAEYKDRYNARDWTAFRELLTDDFVVVDHRLASLGQLDGPDAFIEALQLLIDLDPGRRAVITAFPAPGPQGRVAIFDMRGLTVDGAETTETMHILGVIDSGHFTRIELFADDALAEALRRSRELGASPADQTIPTSARVLENECSRTAIPYQAAIARGDFDAIRAMSAEDVVYDDRRAGLVNVLHGRDAFVANIETIAALGPIETALDVLAIRGQRLALANVRWRFQDPNIEFEVTTLNVVENNEDGLCTAVVSFDEHDIESALAELDDRSAAIESSPDPLLVRLVRDFGRAYTDRDVTAMRATMDNDLDVVDHRPASSGTLDKDGLIAWIESAFTLTEHATAYVSAFERLERERTLVRFEVRGTTNEGVAYETSLLLIFVRTGGLISHAEQFSFDQAALAAARFDALTSARGLDDEGTSVTRVVRSVADCFSRRDWTAFAELFSPAFIRDDRRRGFGSQHGLDAYVESSKQVVQVGLTELRSTPLAWRGDRLMLARNVFRGSDNVVEMFVVYELGTDGRLVTAVNFDVDDFDAALAELDDRYIAREAAPYAGTWTAVRSLVPAYNDRDWSGFRATLSDDFVLVDHRPVHLGTLGPDEWIASGKVQAELAPDVTYIIPRVFAIAEDAVAYQAFASGPNADGAYVEISFLQVALVREGRIARLDFFPLDAEAEAIARFEELSTAHAGAETPLENDCVRMLREGFAIYARSSQDGIEPLLTWLRANCVPTTVQDDRRAGLRTTLVGVDALVEANSVLPRLATDVRMTVVATRGDRLALVHVTFVDAEAFETEMLWLNEISVERLHVATVIFDPDALDAAFAEMDGRFAHGEGAPAANLLELTESFLRAVTARDVDALRALMLEDFVIVDHRLASLGELRGRDAWLNAFREFVNLMPASVSRVVSIPAFGRGIAVGHVIDVGVNDEGGEVEMAYHLVGLERGGLLARLEVFALEEFDAALARFHELASGPSGSLSNAATAANARLTDLFLRKDWDALAAQYDDALVSEGRRSGLGMKVGKHGQIAQMQIDIGIERIDVEPLAIRGDRLALSRHHFYGKRYDAVLLGITEVTEGGLIVASVTFDESDIDAAFHELELRFSEGEGADFADVVHRNRESVAVINARDWVRYGATATDGFVFVDHRPASLGTLDMPGLVEANRSLFELIPDIRIELTRYLALDVDRWVAEIRAVGHTADGDPLELAFFNLGSLRAGKVHRSEFFAIDRLQDALARFDRFAGAQEPFETTAVRVGHEQFELLRARDWDALRALTAPDATAVDRRSGLGNVMDSEEMIANAQAIASIDTTRLEFTPIATRGDRLVLGKNVFANDDPDAPLEVELLVIYETTPAGQIVFHAYRDVEDLDGAFAELDDRYLAQGGDGADVWRAAATLFAAHADRDWDAVSALIAEDVDFADHRPASLGRIRERARLVDAWKVMADLAPDIRFRGIKIERITRGLMLAEVHNVGTSLDGGAFVVVVHALGKVEDGRFVAVEFFAPEDGEAAGVRFEELGSRRDEGAVVLHGSLRNAAIDADVIGNECFVKADWDGLADLLDDAFIAEDRRAGLRGRSGKNGQIEVLKAARDLGVRRIDITPIATRGDRLALSRLLVTRPAGDAAFESEVLAMTEVTPDGRPVLFVAFDEAALDAAIAELDERYIAGEAASFADVWQAAVALTDAINRADGDAIRRVLSHGYTTVDHRPASWGSVHGADEFIRMQEAWHDLMPVRRVIQRQVLALSTGTCLGELHITGRSDQGSDVDTSRLALIEVRDGLLMHQEWFPLDQADAARARFAELGPRPDAADAARTLENHGVRSARRFIDAFGRRDWDFITWFFIEDYVFEDRRPGLHASASGKDAGVENIRGAAENGANGLAHEPIAVRGENLVLARYRWEASDWENDVLVVDEYDAQGRSVRGVVFGPEDLDAAFAELEIRFAEGEGAEFAEYLFFSRAFMRALNAMDIGAMRELMSDDCVFVDHRPASFGRLRADEYLASLSVVRDLLPESHYTLRAVHLLDTNASLSEVALVGRTAEGTLVEQAFFGITRIENGRAVRIEMFDEDHLDEARARFHELAEPALSRGLANAATRFVRRLRDTMNTGTIDEFVDLHAPSFTLDDRRAGLRHITRGPEEIRRYWSTAREGMLGRFDQGETLAIRGDHLVLSRRLYKTSEGTDFESERLVVDEVNDAGRVVAAIFFDPDDTDAAFDELEARYLSGEARGTPHESIVRSLHEYFTAYNRRDWTTVASLSSPDLLLIDHRPAGAGTLAGPDETIRYLQVMIEQAPDVRIRLTEFVALGPITAIARMWALGTTSEGGAIEVAHFLVFRWTDGLVRVEIFPFDMLEEALACFTELGPQAVSPAPPPLENTCTRTWDAACVTFAEKRWDDHVDYVAEDVVTEDRRPGLQNILSGRDAFMDVAKVIASFGPVLESTVLAIRGDRLALYRHVYVPPPDDPRDHRVEALGVLEVDADGRIWRVTDFEPDDIDAAFDELDRRYLAGAEASDAAALRVVFDQFASYNSRNWEAFAGRLTDDHVFVDHRPASAGTVTGADGHIRYLQTLIDLAPDVGGRIVEVLRVASDRVLARVPLSGRTQDGAAIEIAFYMLHVLRGGRLCRLETYPFEAREAAIARFDELARSPDDDHPCVLWRERRDRAIKDGHWAAAAELYAEDTVFEDRRRGLGARIVGREAVLEHARLATPGTTMVSDTLATRGERIALIRGHITTIRGYEVEAVLLHELDTSGRQIYNGLFDPDDLDNAFAELDARYVAGEGAGYAALVDVGMRFTGSFNERRWDDFLDVIADDVVFVDHRPASLGSRTRTEWVEAVVALIDLIPTLTIRYRAFRAIEPDRFLAHTIMAGASADGADVEIGMLTIALFRDGKAVVAEVFPDDALDAARAAYEALSRSPDDDHPCLRNFERVWELMAAGDWAALSELLSPDVVYEDHRRGLGDESSGRAGALELAQTIASIGPSMSTMSLLASRGERLALIRNDVTSGGFEIVVLVVVEMDAEGLGTYAGVFDPDDLESALDTLDERFIAGESAAHEGLIRGAMATRHVWNADVWDPQALAEGYTESLELIDHRALGAGHLYGRDAWIAYVSGLREAAPDLRMMHVAYEALAAPIVLVRLRLSGSSPHGGPVEIENLVLCTVPDGRRVDRLEYFAPEDLDGALARCAELVRDTGVTVSLGPQLENAAFRAALRGLAAAQALDWTRVAGSLADDVVTEDRRPGLGSRVEGKDAVLDHMRGVFETGATFTSSLVATRGDRLCLTRDDIAVRGFVVETMTVTEIDAAGVVQAIVFFTVDRSDDAYAELDARFAKLTRTHRRLENAATRHWEAFRDAWNSRTWDGSGAEVHPDVVIDDRRSGLSNFAHGRESYVTQLQIVKDLEAAVRIDYPLAIRGEHLSLVSLEWYDPSGRRNVAVRVLHLNEVDENNLLVHTVVFEPDDVDAALAELDARFFAGEGAPYAAEWRLAFLAPRLFNIRDFDAYGDAFTEDFVLDDHRPAGWGREEGGPDARVAKGREMVKLSPDAKVYITEIVASAPDALTGRFTLQGTSTDGNPFEIEYLSALGIRDGRVYTMDYYDPEDEVSARARFEQLASSTVAISPELENAVTRAAVGYVHAFRAADWVRLAAHYAEDAMRIDLRSGLRSEKFGRTDIVRGHQEAFDLGFTDMRLDTIATRGDHLALFRALLSREDGYEVELLGLNQLDETGRITTRLSFDPDDLEAAFDEIDERYIKQEGPAIATTLRVLRRISSSANTRDWESFLACFSQGMAFVDHQLVGFGESSGRPDAWGPGMTELIPDVRLDFTAILAIDDRGGVTRTEARGHDTLGNPIEMTWLNVGIVKDGVVVRLEQFPLERLDDALARFEELNSE